MISKLDITPRTRILVGLLGSAAWLAAAGPAAAQDGAPQPTPAAEALQPDAGAAQDEGNEVVVTGFRASLTAALGAKRNDTGIVDVIVAEDIADFPDQNLAESLQRIPGVVDRPRRRRRPLDHGPRARCRFHPHPPQRARGAGHHRRHR